MTGVQTCALPISITYETDDLHASGYAPNYVSEHELLFMERGCRIHFLIAEMLPAPEAFQTAEPLRLPKDPTREDVVNRWSGV